MNTDDEFDPQYDPQNDEFDFTQENDPASRAFWYTNRKGDTYLLQSKDGKNGKRKYSFARKLTGEPVAQLPAGYEVRELPETAQVVIRKCKPSAIFPEEKAMLEDIIRKETVDLHAIVDVEESSLVIYTSEAEEEIRRRPDFFQKFAIRPLSKARERQVKADWIAQSNFHKMLRFTLVDEEERLFHLERWCFRGSIDNWFYLTGDWPLATLAKKYVRHLGNESFFELM